MQKHNHITMPATNEKDIGALWIRAGKKSDYMTGTITIGGVATEIVLFPNSHKKSQKQPDWRIYHSRKREEEAEEGVPKPW